MKFKMLMSLMIGVITLGAGPCNSEVSVSQPTTSGTPSVFGVSFTGANGQLTFPVPAGSYDGTQMATAYDSNLVAGNIVHGATIFGVQGIAAGPYAICSDHSFNSTACSTAPGRYVTNVLGGSVTGANGSLTQIISAGYYNGTTLCTMSDTNLLAGNIKAGVTIFGMSGASSVVDTTGGTAKPEDILALKTAYVNGELVTGKLATGSDITTWSNRESTTTVTASIMAGYYNGQSCRFTSSGLTAGNICKGNSIFNVYGNAVCEGAAGTGLIAANENICSGYYAYDDTGVARNGSANCSSKVSGFSDFMASTQHRSKTTPQMTLKTESVINGGTLYVNDDPGYRAIPKLSKDDEGYTGGSVTYVDRTTRNWDKSCDASGAKGSGGFPCKCGMSGSLGDRIAHCAAHGVIGAEASWNGAIKGNAGQGAWRLVTRTGSASDRKGREIWQDQRTGLLWSSLVATGGKLNWCKASGSNNIQNNPAAEADPSNHCSNGTYQNIGTGPGNKAVSACFEDGENYFTQIDNGNIDSAGKGGLGIASVPVVGWRLPTKYDYQQADNNGIIFVMPDMGTFGVGYEWSATIYSGSRNYAWTFAGNFGGMLLNTRASSYAVRCVGR